MKLEADAPKIIKEMSMKYFPSQEANQKQYEKARKLGKVLDHPYTGADLVTYGHQYYVLDHNKKEVTYLMKWETRKLFGKTAAYQVMVWSSPATKEIRGYAPKVFFQHLFALNELICTDRLQTFDGARFWVSVSVEALDKGLYLYLVDLNSQDPSKRLQQIPDKETFNKLTEGDQIWNHEQKGQAQLLVIAQEPLGTSIQSYLEKYPTVAALLGET